jgi:hypothetical protein
MLSARGGVTVAMQEIQPWLIETLKPGDFFTKSVGVARCSDKENYNKKTGREIAQSRMKLTVLTVVSIKDYSNVKTLILKDSNGNLFDLQKKHNCERVHFIGYEKC